MINTFVVHNDDRDKETDQKPKFTALRHTTLTGFHWPPPFNRCILKPTDLRTTQSTQG